MRPQHLTGLLLILACHADANDVEQPSLIGEYVATTLAVGSYDALSDVLTKGGTMTLSITDDSTFSAHVDLPAPYAPFWNDPGGYAADLTGTYRLGQPPLNLELHATGATPVWVTRNIQSFPDSIRGFFESDPDHDVGIAFTFQRAP